MHELDFSTASIFIYFEVFATIIFSVVGGILGNSSLRKDMASFARVSLISSCSFLTANGGGTVRDLLLGQKPFWMNQLEYAIIPLLIGVSVALFFSNTLLPKAIKLLDDLSAGIFVCTGVFLAQKTVGINDVAFTSLAIVFGTLTAIGGGILRDVFITRKTPAAFQSSYGFAAFAGSIWMTQLVQITTNSQLTNIVSTLIVVLILNQSNFVFTSIAKASKRVRAI